MTTLQRGAPAQTPLWTVPPRNPYFTGREELLTHLHETLTKNQQAALTQSVAISGLGGIGKTQTATEYAYRYRNNYQHIFWVKAETRQELLGDLASIAHSLDLAEPQEQNQTAAVQAILRWLETHSTWLLILDNADDLKMVSQYLPRSSTEHILLTTRADAPGKLARKVEVNTMPTQEGILFLLRRAGLIVQDAPTPDAVPVAEQTAAADLVHELDGLPLALDQAGAYIEETRCGVSGYLPLYRKHRTKLLSRRGGINPDHPAPVATTWSLSFNKVEATNPAAADLLRLCSFLAPQAIPQEIFTEGAPDLGSRLQPVAADSLALNEAICELLKYSLVSRDSPSQTLTVHRLVQAVLRDSMNKQAQRRWAERVVKAVGAVFQFPHDEIWVVVHMRMTVRSRL
jgi:NB-ARC domain